MPVRVIRLGSPRAPGEGLRIGTVRRPPRGVPKAEYASRDLYDVWFPNLSPSESLLNETRLDDDRHWAKFCRRFRAEMKEPAPRRDLDLLAALSHQANFSLGCYCRDERRCHRSVLRELLAERGAEFAGDPAEFEADSPEG
jgi:uncharacterized protein YeaO (DUF488 family)